MAFYQRIHKQIIPASKQEVWDFIATPQNLAKITPDFMNFKITIRDLPQKMYAGMIISYRLNPVPGISTSWITEITHIESGKYFVDEQRKGPYRMWHHEHFIESHPKGVLMTDIVSYIPPLGLLGAIANKLFINRLLNKIFDYRTKALDTIFGKA